MTYAASRLTAFDPCPADPILGCLIALARRRSRLVDEDRLTGGLSLGAAGRIAAEDIPRVAGRAGFSTVPFDGPLDDLTADRLPALLLLVDGDACILTARRPDGAVQLLLPDLRSSTTVPAAALAARYAGRGYALRWRELTDVEAPPPAATASAVGSWRPHLRMALAALPADLAVAAVALLLARLSGPAAADPWLVATMVGSAVFAEGALRLAGTSLLAELGHAFDLAVALRLIGGLLGRPRPGATGAFAAALQAAESDRRGLFALAMATLAQLPLVVLLLGGLVALGGPLAGVAATGLVIQAALGLAMHRSAERAARHLARDQAKRQGLLVDLLNTLDTVRGLALQPAMEKSWVARAAALARSAANADAARLVTAELPGLLQAAGLAVAAVWGCHLVETGRLGLPGLAACLLLTTRLLAYGGQAGHLLARRQTAAATLRAMRRAAPDRPTARRQPPRLIAEAPAGLQQGVVASDLTFRHRGMAQHLLTGANFQLFAGERVALTGAPGCGKTTLARLLAGQLQPSHGKVLFDGAAENAPQVAYLPQEAPVFTGSLRDNLLLGRHGVGIEAVRRAVAIAGIEAVAERCGLDAALPDDGGCLSAGERQGLALARVLLLAEPALVLLDDPCSAWDDPSLERLADRLGTWLGPRTLVLITQRRPLLAMADRVLHLESGRVMEVPAVG